MEESEESKPVQEKPIEQTQKKEQQKPVQEKKPGIFSRLANRFVQYRRVLEVSTKPDKQELVSSIKITLLGIALLGIIGFVIFLVYFLVI